MKKLYLGNEAVARGLYEAGCKVISSYPGTPSTEITEFACEYKEMYSEWAPNEKVACEVASGAAIAGARAFCGMKHVGLNVAADPLFTMSYIGVNAGLVIGVADDPGMHSSQNEQDSRHYAIAAKLPMLEPADSAECLEYTKLAFEISEEFDTPVILRLTTRISHSRSLVELSERLELPLKEYHKDPQKNVMMPAMAIKRHQIVEKRTQALIKHAETLSINSVEINEGKIGVISSGIAYQYAKEAFGDQASYLKLGMINPLPVDLIKEFAEKFEKVYVIEELDDIIETHCRKNGIDVIGKNIFTYCGEYFQSLIKEKVFDFKPEYLSFQEDTPPRPPVMCSGCPHRGLFYTLKKLKVFVSGDIGCYTLGALPPLQALDTCICMGASISSLHGRNIALGKDSYSKSVAVIGDSTFIHSGITGLIDIAYNKGISTIIVLDNSITGMTGHQQNPTTGFTINNDPTVSVDLSKLANSVGINRVEIIDPYNLKECESVIKQELEVDEPSLIIARRPCALLKKFDPKPALAVDQEKCTTCKMCMRIGCPAISLKNGKANIDEIQCVGCDLCSQMCKFGAIKRDRGGDENDN